MSETIGIMGNSTESFHHVAAMQLHGPDVPVIPTGTHVQTLQALLEGRVDRAILAIYNNNEGYTQDLIRLLSPFNNGFEASMNPESNEVITATSIVRETYVTAKHMLLGLDASIALGGITQIRSHYEAFKQCNDFVSGEIGSAMRIEDIDTATAARNVRDEGDPTKVAIASLLAAKAYGLEVIQADVQDVRYNFTRFIELMRRGEGDAPSSRAKKASGIIKLPHIPGALLLATVPFECTMKNNTDLEAAYGELRSIGKQPYLLAHLGTYPEVPEPEEW
jgi:prephenate dehydratase